MPTAARWFYVFAPDFQSSSDLNCVFIYFFVRFFHWMEIAANYVLAGHFTGFNRFRF